MTRTAASLPDNALNSIADALNQALAETVVATMLAQNFHWNVKGMAFGSLHSLFQQIYEDHFAAQDDLAERIRAIGKTTQARLSEMVQRSRVKDHREEVPDTEMLKVLAEAQSTLAATLADAGATAAEHGDTLTEDLAIARGQIHEKFAWILRSHLQQVA